MSCHNPAYEDVPGFSSHVEVLIDDYGNGQGLAGCIGCTRTRYVDLPWRALCPPRIGTVLPAWARPTPRRPPVFGARPATPVSTTPYRRHPMRQRLFGLLLLLVAIVIYGTPVWPLAVVPAGLALFLAMSAGRGKTAAAGRTKTAARR